jgi:hypothetical protein
MGTTESMKVPRKARRAYVSQSDVPAYSLKDALRVAEVLRDEYGKQPTKPLDIAKGLDMAPNSGQFRGLAGAALAFGITDAGPFADVVGLTELGRRIMAPVTEGDDLLAMREALLRPRVVREFLRRYDGSPLPSQQIAYNVLEAMGVPTKALQRTQQLIVNGAQALGLLVEIKGKLYVSLDAVPTRPSDAAQNGDASGPVLVLEEADEGGAFEPREHEQASPAPPESQEPESNLVFISHGSNQGIVEQIKKILSFGKFEPVVSVERQATAKPVPDKVMDDMRRCYAGIVHVGTEKVLMDAEGKEHRVLNENVLIEIGAAMALFDRRFVLLVETGVILPSNLQGLYQVRYEGDRLDYEATMKLLEAFNEFRSNTDKQGR